MHVLTMPLGAYQTNCYLVWQEGCKRCLLIDPGYVSPAVMQQLTQRDLHLEAILLTHGHFDHVGGVRALAEATGCRVFLCKEDAALPEAWTGGPLYYTGFYAEADHLTIADLAFTVLHTPGHTPGSVCLLFDEALFSGDTLFAGSCGRTDLPGGNSAQIMNSLARLAALPGDYPVFPGHGESTTLSQERQNNPYMEE